MGALLKVPWLAQQQRVCYQDLPPFYHNISPKDISVSLLHGFDRMPPSKIPRCPHFHDDTAGAQRD